MSTVAPLFSAKTGTAPRIMTAQQWQACAADHAARIGAKTDPLMQARRTGAKDPVFDFMFSYYSLSPAHLKRWHPGVGHVLLADEDGVAPPHANYKHYVFDPGHGGWRVDVEGFLHARGSMLGFAHDLISRTAGRRAHLACFGLHEWAMAYRSEIHGIRHSQLPLRLGAAGTDEVVESHKISCTHFDAFRFYAPEARQFNTVQPTRERAPELEQPGCLHANMDLYRHCGKLAPVIPADLMADTFELAWDIRAMDMQASPYDLSGIGWEPIRIETAEGKAEYVAAQREFSNRSQVLRARILDVLTPLVDHAHQLGVLPARAGQTSGGRQ